MPKASFLWHDIAPWGPIASIFFIHRMHILLGIGKLSFQTKTASNHYFAPLFSNTYCHDSQRRCGIIAMVASSAAFRRFSFWYYWCCFPLVSQQLEMELFCPIPGTLHFALRVPALGGAGVTPHL